MTLDPISEAVVNAVPAHPMAALWEETIPTSEGGIVVRIHQPRVPAQGETMGAVIYFHGGGFFAGSLDDTDLVVRQIALDGDVVVFNIDYHLTPEATFPVAVNDAYAALEWVAAEAGAPVEYARFEGTIHGFVSMAAVIPTGAQALALICERIKAVTHATIAARSSREVPS